MARPQKKLNEKEIENYASLGASNRQIANMLSVDEGTIRKRFSAILAKARGERGLKLRALQWKAAEAGSVAMLIFLGKNELDQSDSTTLEHTGPDGGPVKTETKHTFNYGQFARELGDMRRERNSATGSSGPADRN